jgi:hypothetical protein
VSQVTIKAPAHPCLLHHYSFTIAKLWKHSRYPTTDEWIKKMWYLYTMEFLDSHKEEQNFVIYIILSEASQTQKAKSHMFSLICGIQMHQYYETLVTVRQVKHWRG